MSYIETYVLNKKIVSSDIIEPVVFVNDYLWYTLSDMGPKDSNNKSGFRFEDSSSTYVRPAILICVPTKLERTLFLRYCT